MKPRPPSLEDLGEPFDRFRSIVYVHIGPDDGIVEANEGFRLIATPDQSPPPNMEELLHGASLTDWRAKANEATWSLVHDGVVHLGLPDAEAYSLNGHVYGRGDDLILIAEHDLAGYERLGKDVLELNTELAKAQREMTRNLRERERAEKKLEEKAQALERSNRDLHQFANVISHDLQEPLRTIAGHLELLEDQHREDLDEDALELLNYAVEGSERMQEMIQALLEYSRVSTEPVDPETVDANDALHAALANLEAAIDETGARIDADSLPRVRVEEDQLVQVFQNLIGNAVKFCDDADPRVEIRAERTGDEIVFRIRDNGPGVPEEEQEEIFEVFRRGSDASKDSGTGIGLAVCSRIVERYGGSIWLDSEPGEGATFSFTLPAADGEPLEDGEGAAS